MEVNGAFDVPAPRTEVWNFLLDVPSMATCVPGCEKVEATGDGRFEGILAVKIGPISAKFRGDMGIVESVPPDRLVSSIIGVDRFTGTRVEMQMTFRLQEGPDAQASATRVEYAANIRVTGKLAQFGHSLIQSETRKMLSHFGQEVGKRLRVS